MASAKSRKNNRESVKERSRQKKSKLFHLPQDIWGSWQKLGLFMYGTLVSFFPLNSLGHLRGALPVGPPEVAPDPLHTRFVDKLHEVAQGLVRRHAEESNDALHGT